MNKYRNRPGRKFEVIKATQKPSNEVVLGDRHFKFGRQGAFYLNDAGIAAEIEKEFGHKKGNGDVVISPIELVDAEGHRWNFPGVETPWRDKKWRPQDDPDYEEVRPGVWREIPEKREKRGRKPEVKRGKTD